MPAPGEGRIDCQVTAGRLHQTVSSAYPLKIISPQAVPNPTEPNTDSKERLLPAVSYILSYGGGIVHGDQIHVDVRSGTGSALMILTQGSTKVYRRRAGRPPSFLKNEKKDTVYDSNQTYQTMLIDVEPQALVCLLPDPVTCFEGALYNQRQAVRLHSTSTSSLVLLDWMTSGRMSRGERWAFSKYLSINVVAILDGLQNKKRQGQNHDSWIGESRIIIRDALLLENTSNEQSPSESSFARRLSSIDAFAYLLVLGPAVSVIADLLRKEHMEQRIKPFRPNNKVPESDEVDVQWSVSDIDECDIKGVAVRIAGPNTENVKAWIKRRLAPLQYIVGDSAWSMYCNA
ncbi:UreD urease accessory protein-domain-containing protein [Coemansia spiralis]|nr:UreD urease accessory protein-domain-containing protein [Coemansia spiralis]